MVLYIKTTSPPEGRDSHRHTIGPSGIDTPVHLMMVFRGRDLTIYRDGVVTDQLRGAFAGDFSNWTPAPLVVSRASELREQRAERKGEETGKWFGSLFLMSLKGTQETSRQRDENVKRFQAMIGL